MKKLPNSIFTHFLSESESVVTDWSQYRNTGSVEALERFVVTVTPKILPSCLKILGNIHDTEDAIQAGFISLIKNAQRLTAGDEAMAWLYRSAVNEALNLVKKRQRQHKRESDRAAELTDTPSELSQHDRESILDQVMKLPERERQAILLHYFASMTHSEIAHQLNMPRGNVGQYIARGLARLKNRLTSPWSLMTLTMIGSQELMASTTFSPERIKELLSSARALAGSGILGAVGLATSTYITLALAFGLGLGLCWNLMTPEFLATPQHHPSQPPAYSQLTARQQVEFSTRTAFEQLCQDRLQLALDDLILGETGQAVIRQVKTSGTVIVVEAEIHHGIPRVPASRVWLSLEQSSRDNFVLIDVDSSGQYWPVKILRDPVKWKLGFPNHKIRLGPLARASAAMLEIPRSALATKVREEVIAEMKPIVARIVGNWQRSGSNPQQYTIRLAEDHSNFAFELYRTNPWKEALAISWHGAWPLPDGSMAIMLTYDCGVIVISPNGVITGPDGKRWQRLTP